MGLPPSDALALEDATDLTAFDGDPGLLGCLHQRIQAPLRWSVFLLCLQAPICSPLQPPRRCRLYQGDDLAVVRSRQAAWPACFGPITQSIYALFIETMQPTTHRLSTTMQLFGNRLHILPIPTARHHACMQDTIGWSMSTGRQFSYLALFLLILSGSHSQNLRHLLAPFLYALFSSSLFYHYLRNAAIGDRFPREAGVHVQLVRHCQ
jgi:hypothetical protein